MAILLALVRLVTLRDRLVFPVFDAYSNVGISSVHRDEVWITIIALDHKILDRPGLLTG